MISVVVPVYNVEKYIDRCVKSICGQSYKDIEIILVDDGSTDRSGFMCDELSKTDERIKVIHKENGGLSDARNAGLAAAKGEYICFIDSDDWIETDTLMMAYGRISEADVVVWGYYKDYVDENEAVIASSTHKTNGICTKGDGYKVLIQNNVMEQVGYAWNKLYKTQIIRENRCVFEKGLSLIEDMVFNIPLFIKCSKILFIDYVGGHYMQRSRTTLGSAYYPDRLQLKYRTALLQKQLLHEYGAPKDVSNTYYGQCLAASLKSTVIMIASLNAPYADRKSRLNNTLSDPLCDKYIAEAIPKSFKDNIVIQCMKYRLTDLLLLICKR